MCGISALFAISSCVEMASIFSMTESIRHRGPDDEGYLIIKADSNDTPVCASGPSTHQEVIASNFPYSPKSHIDAYHQYPLTVAMGHRRLSIVDLSPAGHQPMCSEEKLLWIIFNGEIYNYIEIRHELESRGYNFITQSDTEVILKAYQEWGTQALHQFNGMFAFVILDLKENKIFAARDRFGVKPLYYWISPEGFLALGSEIKQFNALPGWDPKLNGQRSYDFLNWGVLDHTHETMFSGVNQVRGGEFLELPYPVQNQTQILPKKWYNLKPAYFSGSLCDATEQYKHLLEDAVKLRLRADVDIGSCLSGGLDSSSIVCLSSLLLRNQGAQSKQKTFSACSHIPRFNEKDYMDLVVAQSNVSAHFTYPTLESLLTEMPKINWHQDEPYSSTSVFAQWLVFKDVRENGVKVMLDGQGADEQLAGYHGFFGNHFYDMFFALQWIRLIKEMKKAKQLHSSLQPIHLLMNKLVPNIMRQPIRKMFGKTSTNSDWLDAKRLKAEDRDPFLHSPNKTMAHQSRLQMLHSNLPMLLHYEDRNSMAHSVESRTPFLDYRLVEFTLGLPTEFKLSNGLTKRVLRESMAGIIPELIRTRLDKMAFETPEEVWMRGEGSQHFMKALDQAIERSQGILRPSLKEHASLVLNGKHPYNYQLWRAVAFGNWLKQFNVTT